MSNRNKYEQWDRNGEPIRCANGSDLAPCYRRPALALRTAQGQFLGSICGGCAYDLIAAGKAQRSADNAARVVLSD